MTDQTVKDTVRLAAALADESRVRVLTHVLANGPTAVGDIAKEIGVKMINASHHLRVLANAGILEGTRSGRHILYGVCPAVLKDGAVQVGRLRVTAEDKVPVPPAQQAPKKAEKAKTA